MTGRTARGARRPVSPASCSREGRRAPYKSGLCRGALRPSLRGGRRGRGARPNRDLAVQPGAGAAPSKGHAYQACRLRAFTAVFISYAPSAPLTPPPARGGRSSQRDPRRRRGRLLGGKLLVVWGVRRRGHRAVGRGGRRRGAGGRRVGGRR